MERKLPNYIEFSSKVCITENYISNEILKKCLPEKWENVNRIFLWTFWENLETQKAENCFNLVMDSKNKILPSNFKT